MNGDEVRVWRESYGLNPDGGPTLTQKETAKALHFSVKRVRRWTVAGKLPHDREHEGGWPIYPVAALAQWLDDPQGRAA